MDDEQFLNWVADRFVNVIGESENVDFVLALRGMARKQRDYKALGYQGDCESCNVPDKLMQIADSARMWYGES